MSRYSTVHIEMPESVRGDFMARLEQKRDEAVRLLAEIKEKQYEAEWLADRRVCKTCPRCNSDIGPGGKCPCPPKWRRLFPGHRR
jgi:hypothetical protein